MVEKAVNKRGSTPLDDQPNIIDMEESGQADKSDNDVKPLIVPDKIPEMPMLVEHLQLVWNN